MLSPKQTALCPLYVLWSRNLKWSQNKMWQNGRHICDLCLTALSFPGWTVSSRAASRGSTQCSFTRFRLMLALCLCLRQNSYDTYLTCSVQFQQKIFRSLVLLTFGGKFYIVGNTFKVIALKKLDFLSELNCMGKLWTFSFCNLQFE